jgi:hypothetical protein
MIALAEADVDRARLAGLVDLDEGEAGAPLQRLRKE